MQNLWKTYDNITGILRKRKIAASDVIRETLCQRLLVVKYFELKITACLQHGLMKQTNLEDPYDNSGDDEITGEIEAGHGSDEELPPTPPRPSTPQPAKGLPWTPKVRWVDVHTDTATKVACKKVKEHLTAFWVLL